MLKAGTVEEYPAGRHQAHRAQPLDGDRPGRRGPQDAPGGQQGRQRADPRPPSTRPTRERARVEEKAEDQIDKILQPDELPPGVIQLVKVYIAEKRKISVGDKMAGRHGNKGIVARIVPEEDMPFLPDGTPGGHRAQPARRAEPDERGPDPRDPPRLVRRGSSGSRPRPRSSGAPTRPKSACCSGWPGSVGGAGAAARARRRRTPTPDGHHGHGGRPEEGRRRRRPHGPGRGRASPCSGHARVVGRDQGVCTASCGASWWSAAKELAERELAQRRHEAATTTRRSRRRGRRRDRRRSRSRVKELEKTAGAVAGRAAGGGGAAGAGRRASAPRPRRTWDAAADELLRTAGHHAGRQGRLRGRPDRPALRGRRDGGLDLHAEAEPPGGRQDPRPVHRPVLAGHPAAARRQGAVRRPAVRRNGSVGAGGVRRGPRAAGNAHGQVGRRERPQQGVRGHREGPEPAGAGHSRSRSTCW